MNSPTSPKPSSRLYFTPAHAALWMLGSLLFMVLIVGLVSAGQPDLLEDQVSLGALSSLGFLLVSAWLLTKYPGGTNLRSALGARPVDAVLLPLAAALGFCAQAPADGLKRWIDSWVVEQGGVESGVVLASDSLFQSVALLLVLGALVPFAEEAFFRGAVFGALRRSRVTSAAAAVITGLGFTLAHANLQLFLPIALVAALLGFLRAVTGSLYPSLVAHMAFNAVPVAAVAFPALELDHFNEAHRLELAVALPVLALSVYVVATRSEWSRFGREAETQPMFVEVSEAE